MRAILTYHSIDDSGSVISLDEKTFARHVDWLAASGVLVVAVDELLRLPPSTDAVAITFDDAYINFATLAWPRLRDHGFPATLFVATDFAGSHNNWDRSAAIPTLPLIDWPGLGRLAEEGVVLGSHSGRHRDLRRLSSPELEDEVSGSASRIEAETGVRPLGFAYPFGFVNDGVEATVGRSHTWACTTELRVLDVRDRACRLPRLDAYYFADPRRLERWGTRGFSRYLRMRGGARWIRSTLKELGTAR